MNSGTGVADKGCTSEKSDTCVIEVSLEIFTRQILRKPRYVVHIYIIHLLNK